MGFRFLTESSALGFSENKNLFPPDSSIEIKPVIYDKTAHIIYLKDFQEPAKFHIGMLTISLLAGLAYGGYVTYNCWREKNVFQSYIRNLVIALTCRTFFSILFDGVIILESPLDADGGNTLLSFECISLNLVVAFWLTLTIYIHARVQRNFNSEPSLKLYMFGIPGVAVYFAMVQIFAMEGTHSSQVWWLIYHLIYFYQWVVNSLRLLYLLVQLALLIDIGRMMVVKSTDNDTVSLIRKVVALMAILVLLFWLQFGLSVGRPPENNPQPYLYVYYLIDGTQCVLVCAVLFFFNKWVPMILDKLPNITMENGEIARRISTSNDEVLISGDGGRAIVTIGSLFMKEESGRWTNTTSDGREDIVYSSVVQPQNLQKTIDLYKRLNVIPADQVTIVEGEEFYDCDPRHDPKRSESLLFKHIRNSESGESPKLENKLSERVMKKNAFYSSKYLIVDPKEKDFPRYLETRPCIFPARKESAQEEVRNKPPANLETLRADELVKKWLTDHSIDTEEAQQKRKSFQQACNEEHKVEKEEVWENRTKLLEDHRPNEPETIFSTVQSDLLGTSFVPKRKKSMNFESNPEILSGNNDSIQNPGIIEVRPHKNPNLEKGGINSSNDQFRTEKNLEVLDLRVAERRGEGDVKIIEINERAMQKNAKNNFESTENFQEHGGQKETIKKIYEIQNGAKDDTSEIPEDSNTNAKHSISKSGYEINLTKSALEETIPMQEKKNLIPTRDTEGGVTLKDEPKAPEFRSEAETDTEKSPETLVKNNLFENVKGSDLKKPQDFQSLSNLNYPTGKNLENKTSGDSEPNNQFLTYPKLLAFRSQRDELEKDNSEEKDQKRKTTGLNDTNLLNWKPASDFF